MSKIEFFFNNTSFLITKMLLYYDRPAATNYHESDLVEYPKPKLEVEYANINTKPVIEKKLFSVSRYLKLQDSKWQLQREYKTAYEFFDQTQVTLK